MFAFSDKEWPGIAKLIEECGELSEVLAPTLLLSAIGKLMQTQGKLVMIQGGTDHWSGDLRKAMVEEIADVEAAIDFVKAHCLKNKEVGAISRRRAAKLKKFERWHGGREVAKRIARNAKQKTTKSTPKAQSRTSNA